jgi:hypothetical protein
MGRNVHQAALSAFFLASPVESSVGNHSQWRRRNRAAPNGWRLTHLSMSLPSAWEKQALISLATASFTRSLPIGASSVQGPFGRRVNDWTASIDYGRFHAYRADADRYR